MTDGRTERTNWPHDAPGPKELVEAVRDYLANDLGPRATGRDRWMSRVATNALTVALREFESGARDLERHSDRLAGLGMSDEAALAAAIRAGEFDGQIDEALGCLWETTLVKLAVANPEYRDESLEPGGGRQVEGTES